MCRKSVMPCLVKPPVLASVLGLPAAERLAALPDPRDRRGRRHPLTSVLLVASCAVLTGAQFRGDRTAGGRGPAGRPGPAGHRARDRIRDTSPAERGDGPPGDLRGLPRRPGHLLSADVTGVIFHSDRGTQYTSAAFAEVCRRHGIRRSMGRVGSSYDNALAESFFATLKRELLHGIRWLVKAQARLAVFAWLSWYNQGRRHSALGHLSPVDFERQHHGQIDSLNLVA